MASSTKKLSYLALFLSLGLVLNFAERFYSIVPGIPGIKFGLSNIIILIAFHYFSRREVGLLLISRILLSSFFVSSFSSFFYSLVGGLFSYFIMALLYPHLNVKFSLYGLSLLGAFFHNTGQLLVLAYFLKSFRIALAYYPLLIWAGTVSGLATAFIGLKITRSLSLGFKVGS
ncbi:MAG: Gx transporter family protein [Tissierellia bacterium]|nr:Gx transporter family protein [Tissierellia bacterium]